MLEFLFVVLCLTISVSGDDKYTTKYDNVDIDEVLRSDRLVLNYFHCMMTAEGCTTDADLLRKTIPDALETGCSKCSPTQKEKGEKVFRFVYHKKPDLWAQLMDKYDPDKKYRAKYEAELNKIKDSNA